ncbi:unnamed protein product [Calypogeia fissa]
MLISSITVEVGAAWKANINDEQKKEETGGEPRRKDKRQRDEVGPTASAPAPAPEPVPVPEPEKDVKLVRKTRAWILGQAMDQAVFSELIAKKFWNQPIQGTSLEV